MITVRLKNVKDVEEIKDSFKTLECRECRGDHKDTLTLISLSYVFYYSSGDIILSKDTTEDELYQTTASY